MQVPVKEREKLLKKEGLDPTRLTNLTLVYKVQEVALHCIIPANTCMREGVGLAATHHNVAPVSACLTCPSRG